MTPGRRLAELAKAASARVFGVPRVAPLVASAGAPGEARADGDRLITGIAPLDGAGPSDLSVFHHPRYREQFLGTRAGAVIVRPEVADSDARPDCPLLLSDDPYLAFAKVARLLHSPDPKKPGCDPRAAIDSSARVDPSAEVRAFAFVGPGAIVGPGTLIHPFVHVGDGARIGAHCELHSGAVVERGCILGDRVILQAGAVVGSDGFGYAFEPQASGQPAGAHLKVPQVGIVRLEDDVEIGANSCIDRATMGETVVGRGTKIDNLVQVAHNVKIGPLSILCGQSGVAGSAQVGAGVVLGGQAGIIGHSTVGDGAKIAAQAGVMNDVPAGETWSGAPALVRSRWLRQAVAERQLVERLKDLSDLEKRLSALEAALEAGLESAPGRSK